MSRFLLLMRSNWITATGAVITTLAFMAFVTTLIYTTLHGSAHGPYLGLFAFLLLPMVFVAGIGLIPLGLLVYRHQLRQRMDLLTHKPMRLLRVLGVLTLVNLATVGTAGYEAVHYMDSQQFCGKVCHQVMSPTFDLSLDSPHSQIACVQCHIGPGVGSFVQAKLSGLRQVVALLLDSYERPIPTPVHNLPAASEICMGCHSVPRLGADRLLVRHHFADDEAVTQSTNVLLLKVGGIGPDGSSSGSHWHADPRHQVQFITSGKREKIDWIRYVDPTGKERFYTLDGADPEPRPEGELRTMDCLDCHNQPAHPQQDPDLALDAAILSGRISRELAGIKKVAQGLLQQSWQRDTAEASILRELEQVYLRTDGASDSLRAAIRTTAAGIASIWLRNVYPDMNIGWGTYPNFNGHAGCMRCHDGEHFDQGGEVLSFDCNKCHTVLAQQERDAKVLRQFGIEPK